MITVAFVRWNGTSSEYTAARVNAAARMVADNLSCEHRIVCLTDDPAGIECETITIEPLHAPAVSGRANWTKLRAFQLADDLGPRIALMDLDMVVTGDLTPLIDCEEPFRVMAGTVRRDGRPVSAYNSSLVVFGRYHARMIWHAWSPAEVLKMDPDQIGSDQAWLAHVLGPDKPTFTPQDGVYQARRWSGEPSRVVFFAGRVKPWHDEAHAELREIYGRYCVE